jgi:hypothetical protein
VVIRAWSRSDRTVQYPWELGGSGNEPWKRRRVCSLLPCEDFPMQAKDETRTRNKVRVLEFIFGVGILGGWWIVDALWVFMLLTFHEIIIIHPKIQRHITLPFPHAVPAFPYTTTTQPQIERLTARIHIVRITDSRSTGEPHAWRNWIVATHLLHVFPHIRRLRQSRGELAQHHRALALIRQRPRPRRLHPAEPNTRHRHTTQSTTLSSNPDIQSVSLPSKHTTGIPGDLDHMRAFSRVYPLLLASD